MLVNEPVTCCSFLRDEEAQNRRTWRWLKTKMKSSWYLGNEFRNVIWWGPFLLSFPMFMFVMSSIRTLTIVLNTSWYQVREDQQRNIFLVPFPFLLNSLFEQPWLKLGNSWWDIIYYHFRVFANPNKLKDVSSFKTWHPCIY